MPLSDCISEGKPYLCTPKLEIMNRIIIYPKTTRQMSVHTDAQKDDSLFTKERIRSAEEGNYTEVGNRQELEQFLEQL
jgi:hypothetical protein